MKVAFKKTEKNTNMTGCDSFHEEQSQTKPEPMMVTVWWPKSISINGDI